MRVGLLPRAPADAYLCRHFMALYSIALTDASIAVFDAKYHYEFWRPVTAIRNGDIDDNPATEREATWQPLDSMPMHPEYPCAHCIQSGAAAGVIKAVLGSQEIPEVTMMSTHSSLEQHCRIHRGGCNRPHLGRLPLSLFDANRHRDGSQDRQLRCRNGDAARGEGGRPLVHGIRAE